MYFLINSNNNQVEYLLAAIFLRGGLFLYSRSQRWKMGKAKFKITLSDYKAMLFPTIWLPKSKVMQGKVSHKHGIIKNLETGERSGK